MTRSELIALLQALPADGDPEVRAHWEGITRPLTDRCVWVCKDGTIAVYANFEPGWDDDTQRETDFDHFMERYRTKVEAGATPERGGRETDDA